MTQPAKAARVWIVEPRRVDEHTYLQIDFSDDYHIRVTLPADPRQLVESLHYAAEL